MYHAPTGGEKERAYLDIEEAHVRATTLFAENEIKLARFKGTPGYSDAGIRHDAGNAEKLKKFFEQSIDTSKKLADILEAVIYEHGQESAWLGGLNSKVIKTSTYDDYKRNVDMVVETREEIADEKGGRSEYSHLALGIDVTFSGDLHDKFSAIRANMDNGRLGQVKYFLSERPDTTHPDRKTKTFAGPLTNIPQVVVGVEIERVKELALLWMNKKNKKLGEHPVQRLLLQEIALQLKTFAGYARSIGRENLAVIIEEQLRHIEELMKEKRKAGIEDIKHDKVFEEIKRNLLSFNAPQRAAA